MISESPLGFAKPPLEFELADELAPPEFVTLLISESPHKFVDPSLEFALALPEFAPL